MPRDSELKNSANLKCTISHVQLLAAKFGFVSCIEKKFFIVADNDRFFETRRCSFFVKTILAGCCSMMMQYVHPIPEKAEGEPSGTILSIFQLKYSQHCEPSSWKVTVVTQ
jgi:hypothetical protein